MNPSIKINSFTDEIKDQWRDYNGDIFLDDAIETMMLEQKNPSNPDRHMTDVF